MNDIVIIIAVCAILLIGGITGYCIGYTERSEKEDHETIHNRD